MAFPAKQGLYDPAFEHDACGLGFVARLDRRAEHQVVHQGLEILRNLTHRGAAGCDPCTGDGAGILLQLPHELYRDQVPFPLPPRGDLAVAMCFFAQAPGRRRRQEAILEAAVLRYRQEVLGWRDVPIDISAIGPLARSSMPRIRQLFIRRTCAAADFERILFIIRKRAYTEVRNAGEPGTHFWYVASISCRTLVYKGMLMPGQVDQYFPDLRAADM